AAAAHRSALVGDAIARALLRIRLPDLVAVVHELGSGRDRTRRTLARTLVAAVAKGLQPEVDGLVMVEWEIGGDDSGFEPWAQIRIENHLADAAHLSKTGEQQQRRLQYVTVQHGVGSRGVAESADLFRDDAAKQRKAQ